jgi:hypothetical protein
VTAKSTSNTPVALEFPATTIFPSGWSATPEAKSPRPPKSVVARPPVPNVASRSPGAAVAEDAAHRTQSATAASASVVFIGASSCR